MARMQALKAFKLYLTQSAPQITEEEIKIQTRRFQEILSGML